MMKFNYNADRATVERICEAKGCYVKMTPGSDIGVFLENSWTIPGDPTQTFQLEHCILRMPSEHTFNGISYPLEVQCQHYQDGTDKKRKGILSVLYETGMSSYEDEEPKETFSAFIASLEQNLPNVTASKVVKPFTFAPQGDKTITMGEDTMPAGMTRYVNYIGSHTVGNCEENAEWYVMYDPRGVGAAQLKTLKESFSQGWHPPRPAQKLYGRHPDGCMHDPIPEDAASPTALGAIALALAVFSAVARA
jgi:carbonic anhydrase